MSELSNITALFDKNIREFLYHYKIINKIKYDIRSITQTQEEKVSLDQNITWNSE